jgi:hypothetical protein
MQSAATLQAIMPFHPAVEPRKVEPFLKNAARIKSQD